MSNIDELPSTWSLEQIGKLCIFNPKHDKNFSNDLEISFVPMNLVDEKTGTIKKHDSKLLGEVKKGYTHFTDGDVIFAKITPCMENGKSAVARNLINGLACGSTEFHVLRSNGRVLPDYLLNFLRQASYLHIAAGAMTGVVGQRRLPKEFLLTTEIPLPPLNEQRRIVAKIEALKARSQRVKDALEDIPQLLDQFRQSVLAAAFRGDLTADWREQNSNVEPASVLLEKINKKRGQKLDEKELSRISASKKHLKDVTWKITYKEADSDDIYKVPNFPETWIWTNVESICSVVTGKTPSTSNKDFWDGEIPFITPSQIDTSGGILPPNRTLTELGTKQARIIPENSILAVCIGTVGKIGLLDRPAVINQQLNALIPDKTIFAKFLYYWSQYFLRAWIIENASATVNAAILNKSRLATAPVILAPFEEQKRIVSLLEKYFAIINGIKKEHQQAKEKLEILNQSILSKAFRGELIPQDPKDEPASVLLERIRAERDKLETKTAKKSTAKTSTRRTKNTQLQAEEPVQLDLGLE